MHLALAKNLYWGHLDYDNARKELALAQRLLPNDAQVLLLSSYIDRRQGRWDDSLKNMDKALSLDPRGPQTPFMLEQISRTYWLLRRYTEMATTLDRAVQLAPNNPSLRLNRANVAVLSRADIQASKNILHSLVGDKAAAESFSRESFDIARYERNWDEAGRALSVMPSDGCREEAFPFPRTWCEGILERSQGDNERARASLLKARAEVQKIVQQQSNNAPALCVLGLIDAGLGSKNEAVQEAKRALELLPPDKDSVDGSRVIKYSALTNALIGKKDAALRQLTTAAQIPGYLAYGELKLDPLWDPLRTDPRFQKILESLAPK